MLERPLETDDMFAIVRVRVVELLEDICFFSTSNIPKQISA